MMVPNFLERLRTLVGMKNWDYIILWKLSDDHRSVEWMDCCCAGTENNQNGEEEQILFPSSTGLPCRDVIYPHPRIKSCDLLEQVPASITLETGIHSQALLSSQATWLNFSHNSPASTSQDSIGTRVLIPLPFGIIEMFVTKQVTEDQQVIDFVRAQCNIFLEQAAMSNSGTTDSSFSLNANGIQVSQEPLKENLDLPHDISIERIHLCNSPMNVSNLQQFSSTGETGNTNNNIYFDGTFGSNPFTPSIENGFLETETLQNNIFGNQVKDDDSFTRENNRSDDSDLNNDGDEAVMYGKRMRKGPSKNLVAERKRRKKLNDRLYALRALVPNISKLDRASILGDAIDYVMELKKQVEELEIELEEHSDDEDGRKTTAGTNSNDNNIQPSVVYQSGMKRAAKFEQAHAGPSTNNGFGVSKQNHETESTNEKQQQHQQQQQQQMEPQVEVFQLEGNELFVKIFCEHKSGGFVNLLEAMNSLGLEITDVNATRHTCLVSNIFKVEKRDTETIQVNHVRESLLELTRNPTRLWA